jgi:glycosyltransferase involved in cell wall biosynthesis
MEPETAKKLKIVYVTPALYMAGGVERVLTLKANYFAEHFGYDITIILTEGKAKPLFYPLSEKIKVINLNIGFEELWSCSFIRKIFIYLKKQRRYKELLTAELMRIHPDITISLLRREINFINDIKDGSRKIGELHVNRANYRNFEANDSNFIKNLFAKFWMYSLVSKLKQLDRFVVLTEEDKSAWPELHNICVIPDPLSFIPTQQSPLTEKRVIAVGRYVYQKGFDLLLQAWAKIEKQCPDWQLAIYGDGNRTPYKQQMKDLGIDDTRCHLNGPTADIQQEYINSSIFAFSSRFEGFGMVLVEAMACGLPVISFDCPCGPKDIIQNHVDGLLVANGNIEKLAEAIIWMTQHPEQRKAMAAKAIDNVQRFKIDQTAEQWKSLFDSL